MRVRPTSVPIAIDDAPMLHACVVRRDARFDGRFFTGVTTTGIFCRPICPAPTPKLANCRFFPSAAAAQSAGFRPCLRCRPEAAPGTAAWQGSAATVSRALRLIEAGALDGEGGVEALAGRVGLGGRHLRRLFETHLGANPVEVAQLRRVLFAKQLLDETRLPIRVVAESAGFGSLRRFNACMRAVYGRPPSALRGRGEAEATKGAIEGPGLRLALPYRLPFDWAASLAFLARRALPGVQRVGSGCYARALWTGVGPAVVVVADDPTRARLCVDVRLARPAGLLEVRARIRRLFDLDADPRAVDAAVARLPSLRADVRRRPGLRVPGSCDGFETAVRAILGQQISVAGATTLATRMVERFGEALPAALRSETGPQRLFPRAERLVEAPLESLGVLAARAAAIRGLAAAVVADPSLVEPGDALPRALARWQALPGVGPWTAQLVALRVLREPDALPAGDLGLRRALAEDGVMPTAAEVERRLEVCRPFRAYAAIRLWSRPIDAEAPVSRSAPASAGARVRRRSGSTAA